MNNFKRKHFKYKITVLLVISFFGLQAHAQLEKVINSKGSIIDVRNNRVSNLSTAPTTPLEGDVWFDNSDPNNIVTKVYKDTTDEWITISTGTTWNVVGNANTNDDNTHFLGTTDNQDLVIRTNNVEAARFSSETPGFNSRFLLNPANSWSGQPGTGNLIGINTTVFDQRLRITSGNSDTQSDIQGASIDLFGNTTGGNTGRIDLVGGSAASGTTNAITFWGNEDGNTQGQGIRMVINGQGNVGIGNISPNASAVLDLSNSDQRALMLPSENEPTDISNPAAGMIVYATNRTNAYLRIDNAWKPIAYNSVSNELIFDGDDDSDSTNDNFYYVSFVINNSWKVVRYNKTDVNDEATADTNNNASVTAQPTTLAACAALTF